MVLVGPQESTCMQNVTIEVQNGGCKDPSRRIRRKRSNFLVLYRFLLLSFIQKKIFWFKIWWHSLTILVGDFTCLFCCEGLKRRLAKRQAQTITFQVQNVVRLFPLPIICSRNFLRHIFLISICKNESLSHFFYTYQIILHLNIQFEEEIFLRVFQGISILQEVNLIYLLEQCSSSRSITYFI